MRTNSRQAACPRLLVAALVVLVFALAWQAKLSLYDPHPGSVNPVSVSKLWVNGEKLKVTTSGFLPALWLATLFFFPPLQRRELRLENDRPVIPRLYSLHELYRFLRPPPVR